jgi:hypothetical protein
MDEVNTETAKTTEKWKINSPDPDSPLKNTVKLQKIKSPEKNQLSAARYRDCRQYIVF